MPGNRGGEINDVNERSEILVEIFNDYVHKDDTILEIGCGDARNIGYLKRAGYENAKGIDKIYGTEIERIPEEPIDVLFTMSTLFLLPKTSEWVFEKMARMAQKWIITLEGEVTKGAVIGRDYNSIFSRLGFVQVEHQHPIFNQYGHLRVFKKL